MFGLVRPTSTTLARTQAVQPERWDPWTEMDRVRREMDDFVTRAFGFTPLGRMLDQEQTGWAAPVELYELADHYLFRAHLPGIPREDIRLEVTANRLQLLCERRPQAPENAQVLLSSAPQGRIAFAYDFPVELRPEDVKASYRDGILEVTLPRIEPAKPESFKVAIEG